MILKTYSDSLVFFYFYLIVLKTKLFLKKNSDFYIFPTTTITSHENSIYLIQNNLYSEESMQSRIIYTYFFKIEIETV